MNPGWRSKWDALVALTRRDSAFRAWLATHRVSGPADLERLLSPPTRGGELAYRYDGKLAPWVVARRRGWAACAEVAAYAAAASGLLWPAAPVRLLIEGELSADAAYSHLRVDIAGVVVDPYEQEARIGEIQTVDYVADLDGEFTRVGSPLESFR